MKWLIVAFFPVVCTSIAGWFIYDATRTGYWDISIPTAVLILILGAIGGLRARFEWCRGMFGE